MSYIDLENMVKIVNLNIIFFILFGALCIGGCSSGEYDVEEYQINYVEKTITADTIKKVVIKDDIEIKEDIKKDPIAYTYTIQIGAFSMPSNYNNFLQRAKEIFGADVYSEEHNGLYKIRTGNFTSRGEALKYLDFARSKGYGDAFVLTRNK